MCHSWEFYRIGLLLVLILSRPGGTDPARQEIRPEWRILLYMVADNDLEPTAVASLRELEEVKALGVHAAVQVDLSGRLSGSAWTGSRRFILQSEFGRRGSLQHVSSLGAQDSASPESLEGFLDWSQGTVSGSYTLLALWGHGWGADGLLVDEGANSAMTTAELASVLKRYQVDIVLFDLCSMQAIEVARELALTRTRFIVGSETARHAMGWQYGDMLRFLSTRRHVEPRTLASWLVQRSGIRGGEFTGSVIDVAHLNELIAAVDALFAAAERLPESQRCDLVANLAQTRYLSPATRSFDLGLLFELLDPHLPQLVAQARLAYQPTVAGLMSSKAFRKATGLAVNRDSLRDLYSGCCTDDCF